MENRWRYTIGSLAVPLIVGGIVVLAENLNPNWAYLLFGLAGLSMIWGLWPLIFPKYKLSRPKLKELKRVPDTLTLMHQRIKQIREEQAKKDIGKETANRIQEKMWYALYPIPKSMLKRIHEWQRNDHSRFIRTMELYSKVALGSVYSSRYVNFMCDMGGVLETENVGLQPILNTDSEYKPLKDVLELQYAGVSRKIVKLILKYQRYLYGLSSGILWNNYRTKYLGRQLPIAVEAKVPQFEGYSEDEIMSKLKEDVNTAITKYTK